MATVMFDTLKFVDTLEKAGIPSGQARAISSAVQGSIESVDVATKRDLKDLSNELTASMDKKIRELESRLIARLGGTIIAAITVATAILAFLVSAHH